MAQQVAAAPGSRGFPVIHFRGKTLDKKTTTWLVMIHASLLAAPFTFSWPAFWTGLAAFWVIGGLGIALCYHRLLSHRSFKTPKWVEYGLTLIATLAAQRSPIYWIARHRQHHRYSDREGDPHSPVKGFWWAHVQWVVEDLRVQDENEFYLRDAPDLARDAGHRWIQRTHEIWPLAFAGILLLAGGPSFLVWGYLLPLFFVYHFTWLVNSAGHMWGYQNYKTGEQSRNNPLIALLSFGDGWHNNHHAYPALAHHGHRFWEFDITYVTISVMRFFGLATDVRRKEKKA